MKYPFEECLARPDNSSGQKFLLKDHLFQVALMACEGYVPQDNVGRLRFLAYLLHDSGKAAQTWQDYIRNHGRSSVHHAQLSSLIFSHFGALFLNSLESRSHDKAQLEWLYLVLIADIFNHHGEIANFFPGDPPWLGAIPPSHLLEIDFPGLASFLKKNFPQLEIPSTFSEKDWEERISFLTDFWKKKVRNVIPKINLELNRGNKFQNSSRECLHLIEEASALIKADRMNAAGLSHPIFENGISKSEALNHLELLEACLKKSIETPSAQEILQAREESRQMAVETYMANRDGTIFSLELPTGYGKTLTALSVALKSIAFSGKSRIIYVAPYLSIISQSADQIKRIAGMEVFEDHSLYPLFQGEDYVSPTDEIIRETWKCPVIATTYNQLFRVFFPKRMQDTMRFEGLKDSFVIVDEPQSIGCNSWNVFLKILESAAQKMNFQVLFSTATLPETSFGIFESNLVRLGKSLPVLDRFQVELLPNLNEEQLVEEVKREISRSKKIAVIMNTIYDATMVAQLLKGAFNESCQNISNTCWEASRREKVQIYYLSGRLIPVHKSLRIRDIFQRLKTEEKIIVISTQAIECGVDLSFDVVYRALPIFPSILQTAGRCNRHGEKADGHVKVFTFLRKGSKDTRPYVYTDSSQRNATDVVLSKIGNSFKESDSLSLLEAYYKLLFSQNTYQQPLEFLEQGALGNWERISTLEPFSEAELNKVSLFIPYSGDLPAQIWQALRGYGCQKPQDLWQKYLDRSFRHSFNFREKMRFFSLLYRFVIDVTLDEAREYAQKFENAEILYLAYPSQYSLEFGLLPLSNQSFYQEQII